MLVLDENCKYSGAQVVEPYDCTLNQTDLKVNFDELIEEEYDAIIAESEKGD